MAVVFIFDIIFCCLVGRGWLFRKVLVNGFLEKMKTTMRIIENDSKMANVIYKLIGGIVE